MSGFDQVKYANEYNKSKYEDVKIRVPKGTRDKWKSASQKAGMSVNSFVMEAVEEKIESLKP